MKLSHDRNGWHVIVLNTEGTHPAFEGTFPTAREATSRAMAYIEWIKSLEEQEKAA